MSRPFSSPASSSSSSSSYASSSSSSSSRRPAGPAATAKRSLFLQLFRDGGTGSTPQARARWLARHVAELRAAAPHERAFLEPYRAAADAGVARTVAATLGELLSPAHAGAADREVLAEAAVFFAQARRPAALEALAAAGFAEALDEALIAACVGGGGGRGDADADAAADAAAALELVRWLVADKGCDVRYRDGRAFRCAVRDGNAAACRVLVAAGADVRAGGDAALMLACELGHADVARVLVDSGADVAARDGEALRLASANGHLDVACFLLDRAAAAEAEGGPGPGGGGGGEDGGRGRRPALVRAQGDAALRRAAAAGHAGVVRLLLSRGADPNASAASAAAVGDWGGAPRSPCALAEAAAAGHVPLLRLLAQAGRVPAAPRSFFLALAAAAAFPGRRRPAGADADADADAAAAAAAAAELLAVGDEMFPPRWLEDAAAGLAAETARDVLPELLDAARDRDIRPLVERLDAAAAAAAAAAASAGAWTGP
ncbi:MAG: ankyrin repeat-containing domain protein [Olpidium bornovanus]|uniref:Ankyrin repeat-containing domain protein n=1 Tax=Olpidium bornovanus TaxID=278681 RepID=A0A8H7ZKG1_9FUNG|nr:MAG: ankyrin repeat-containing domain protein [Olpidium bornovanus]